ncbi:MAG TPA: hypothetical protein VKM94_12405 [Blastocatellia bacterium]|nr:hypothetical protein [Blastocatellia bacterium]
MHHRIPPAKLSYELIGTGDWNRVIKRAGTGLLRATTIDVIAVSYK